MRVNFYCMANFTVLHSHGSKSTDLGFLLLLWLWLIYPCYCQTTTIASTTTSIPTTTTSTMSSSTGSSQIPRSQKSNQTADDDQEEVMDVTASGDYLPTPLNETCGFSTATGYIIGGQKAYNWIWQVPVEMNAKFQCMPSSEPIPDFLSKPIFATESTELG